MILPQRKNKTFEEVWRDGYETPPIIAPHPVPDRNVMYGTTAKPLQGGVVINVPEADNGPSQPQSSSGSQWGVVLNVLASALQVAAKAYSSMPGISIGPSTNVSENTAPSDLSYEPTQYQLSARQSHVPYQQITMSNPKPIGQKATARVAQLQAHADRVAVQQAHQQVSHVLDQGAHSQGLPTYTEFHAQNGIAYAAPPDSGTLGITQIQSAQRADNEVRAPQVQLIDYSNLEHAQAAQNLLNYQAQVLENQRQAASAEQQRQADHMAWAKQKAAELRQQYAPQQQSQQPVQRQTQQAILTAQIQKTNQDALIEQVFQDPRNPQNNILQQAQGSERLAESKLAQAELNIDILRAKGELSNQQAQELSVAAKLAAAKNWLQHDGIDNGDGTLNYRGVQVTQANAPMVAYADAKHAPQQPRDCEGSYPVCQRGL